MEGFNHILNWKLLRGSHDFPGKDGGTCINEAAIVATGFEYRRVRTVSDMPSCFSRPICLFAILLNDEAKEVDRQRLLPYVTRLACADIDEVEQQRQIYILVRPGVPPVPQRRAARIDLFGRKPDCLLLTPVRNVLQFSENVRLIYIHSAASAKPVAVSTASIIGG